MSPQSNHVHLPNVINKNSVSTQTYNSDTVLTLTNVSTAAANVKEGEIEENKCSLRHGEALSVDKCLTTEFDCDVKHRAGKDEFERVCFVEGAAVCERSEGNVSTFCETTGNNRRRVQ